MNLISHLLSNAPEDINAPIYVDADAPDRTISWDLYTSSLKKVAVGLHDIGVAEQECVAILSPNEIYSGILADGIIAAGAIYAGLPPTAKPSELSSCCLAAKVRWLFTAPQLLPTALLAAEGAAIPSNQVLIFDPPGLPPTFNPFPSSHRTFSSLLTSSPSPVPPKIPPLPPSATAIRIFTSGTTGTPKAISLPHPAAVARIGPKFFGFGDPEREDTRTLHFVSLHHNSAITFRHRAAIGASRLHVSRASGPAEIVGLIAAQEIESVMLPPKMMLGITALVLSSPERLKAGAAPELESLRVATITGSSVPNSALAEFRALLHPEAKVVVAYGSTELGTVSVGVWTPGRAEGYVGDPTPTAVVRIVDPDTNETVEDGGEGEVWAFTRGMLSEYCGDRKATEEVMVEDKEGGRFLFRTGDKGRLTPEGGLCITGRYKDVFKVGTEMVAPAEVESVILRYSGVEDVVVTDTVGRGGVGLEVKAFVVRKRDAKVVPRELIVSVATKLAAHKAPTGGVTFVAKIPRNVMGKAIRRELEAMVPLQGSEEYVQMEV